MLLFQENIKLNQLFTVENNVSQEMTGKLATLIKRNADWKAEEFLINLF